MNYKNDRTVYLLLLKMFVVIAVAGVAALIYASLQGDPSDFAFSLIAFVVSVAALVMTTLQSLSIARQVKITEKAARLVNDSSDKIEALVVEDHKLEKEIRQDIKLDQEIVSVLEELNVGQSPEERHSVATRIAKLVDKPRS